MASEEKTILYVQEPSFRDSWRIMHDFIQNRMGKPYKGLFSLQDHQDLDLIVTHDKQAVTVNSTPIALSPLIPLPGEHPLDYLIRQEVEFGIDIPLAPGEICEAYDGIFSLTPNQYFLFNPDIYQETNGKLTRI